MKIKRLEIPKSLSRKVACSALLSLLAFAPLQADTLWGETEQIKASKSQLIATLAREHGLAAEHLAWANSMAPTVRIAEGAQLTVPARILPDNPPQNGIVVNLAERGGYLFEEGEFLEFIPVSIGSEEKKGYHTPSGDFEIISRVKNPEWKAPDSDWAEAMEKDRISADSEENPLGEYWFGFDAPTGGYGFHENTAPEFTGDSVSHGCLRLYPEHAEMIYEKKLLQPGDTVRVVNKPVRISHDENGGRYLAVFPGIYDRTDLSKILRTELKQHSLSDFFDDAKIKEMVSKPSGIPQAILERNVTLTNDGEALSEDSYKALHLDGKVIMPTTAFEAFDIQVGYNSDEQTVTLTKGDQTLDFPVDGSGDVTSYRLGNQSFVNAADVLKKFGMPYQWDGREKTLHIEENT